MGAWGLGSPLPRAPMPCSGGYDGISARHRHRRHVHGCHADRRRHGRSVDRQSALYAEGSIDRLYAIDRSHFAQGRCCGDRYHLCSACHHGRHQCGHRGKDRPHRFHHHGRFPGYAGDRTADPAGPLRSSLRKDPPSCASPSVLRGAGALGCRGECPDPLGRGCRATGGITAARGGCGINRRMSSPRLRKPGARRACWGDPP